MYQVDFLCIFLFKTFISGYDFFELNNLTTATIRQSTSPIPTIFYRGINMERNEMSTSNIFKSTDARRKKRKKSTTSSWPWDTWCLLQPKEGKCDQQLIRYYYNMQLGQCATFSYSGCDGNKNNFETLNKCEKCCAGTSYMNIFENSSQTNFCYLQPNPGLCLAMIEKYYYDINEHSCNKFTYGGCGGNQNKFDTMVSCMRTCNPVVRNNS